MPESNSFCQYHMRRMTYLPKSFLQFLYVKKSLDISFLRRLKLFAYTRDQVYQYVSNNCYAGAMGTTLQRKPIHFLIWNACTDVSMLSSYEANLGNNENFNWSVLTFQPFLFKYLTKRCNVGKLIRVCSFCIEKILTLDCCPSIFLKFDMN